MKKVWCETNLSDAIGECQREISELADDMRNAFECTPEVFKDTTGLPREEAADDLEIASDMLSEYDIPTALKNEEVYWWEMRAGRDGRLFRPARRDNVVRCLQACVSRLLKEPQEAEIVDVISKWRAAINWLEAVYFPGMTGQRAA